MRERNISIEAFRFIFMTILCLWHMETGIHFQNHGYLVVEFFFMLSGVLLYNSFLRHPEVGVLDFTIRKYKRFLVPYMLAMIPTFFMYYRGVYDILSADTETTFEGCFCFFLQLIADLFMIRGGIFPPMGNSPTWYLSVLLISGGLLYALLRHCHRQTISIIIPIACLLVYGFFQNNPHHQGFDQLGTINNLSMPLIRGFADMGMGVLTFEVFLKKQVNISQHRKWVDAVGIFCLGIIILLIILKVQRDLFAIIFLPIFIIGLLCQQSCWNRWFTSKLWVFLGGLTYEMLLMHMFVRGPLVKYELHQWLNPWLLGSIYLALVMLCSYLLKYTSKKIQKRLGW